MKNRYAIVFSVCLFWANMAVTTVASAQSTEILPGLTLPQMTTAQRTAMGSATEGSMVFDTNTKTYWFRKDNNWVEMVGGDNHWQLSGVVGNELRNTNTGGFWSKNTSLVELFATDVTNPPTTPAPEEDEVGTRLMWIPSRSAFRAGTSTLGYWSAVNIGLFSFAAGFDVQAKGSMSTAFGYFNQANGKYAIAMGYNCVADKQSSVAIGSGTKAMGLNTLALGNTATASGDYSVAIGGDATGANSLAFGNSTASGSKATAIGSGNTAGGELSTVMGNQNTASGSYSTAMGYRMSTNNKKGAFMIGDSDPDNEGLTLGGAADQLVARFKNGYYLMTSGSGNPRTGVMIANGQTAWSAISDSTRKERFIKADGEMFLSKLKNLRLGSWNYKNQKTYTPERFYGPMAQEIFSAFGKDNYGTIGNDTTVSTINMDGLLFIFSQALEKRTAELQNQTNILQQRLTAENQALRMSMEQSEKRLIVENEQLKAIILKLDSRLGSLEAGHTASLTTESSKK